MPAEKSPEGKVIVLSNRKVLQNAVRQALSELKFPGSKVFAEETEECLENLDDGGQETVIIIDWDLGVEEAMKVFDTIKSKPSREFWSVFVIASEQSEKIVAAASENGVSKIHTGTVTAAVLKQSVVEALKELKQSLPLKTLMSKILEARAAGDFDGAVTLLGEVLKKDASNARIAHELAETHLMRKDWDGAYKSLEPFLAATPPDPRVLHTAAKALIKRGDLAKATGLLERADVINPFNVNRLIDLGNVLLEQNKVEDASAKFDRASAISPENKSAVKGTGTCKLLEGDINEALTLMKDAVSGKELASVFNTAAVLAMRTQNFDKGMNLYEAAAKALKGSPEIHARILYNKGIGFIQWSKIDDARQCFAEAVKLDPSFVNAQHNFKVLSNTKAKKDTKRDDTKPDDIADASIGTKFDDSMTEIFSDQLHDEDEKF